MTSWLARFEKWFSAVAFAEQGEHATALHMVGLQPSAAKASEGLLEHVRTAFAAVAFAEENCPETAREMMKPVKRPQAFLEVVGLKGVRIRRGVVAYSEESFFDVVGLRGARARWCTAQL
jgi:hypothetical protein